MPLFMVVNVLCCSELVINWKKQTSQIDIIGFIKKKNNFWEVDQLAVYKHDRKTANLN